VESIAGARVFMAKKAVPTFADSLMTKFDLDAGPLDWMAAAIRASRTPHGDEGPLCPQLWGRVRLCFGLDARGARILLRGNGIEFGATNVHKEAVKFECVEAGKTTVEMLGPRDKASMNPSDSLPAWTVKRGSPMIGAWVLRICNGLGDNGQNAILLVDVIRSAATVRTHPNESVAGRAAGAVAGVCFVGCILPCRRSKVP